MVDPILTAIIFTYNHENSIANCIESILTQKTYYSYEIHIWDDCSIDNTSEICREYEKKYPNIIKLIVQKENTFLKPYLQLQSYSAIKSIKTKYFSIIDGDDYWCDENKLQIALKFLESNPDYIGFAHDTLQVNQNDGTNLSYIHDLCKCDIENPVVFNFNAPFFLTSSRIFRYADFSSQNVLPIDYLLYYYQLSKGPIYYEDKIMAAYVIGSNSSFANSKDIANLNSMFSYKLSLLFNFKKDDFCMSMQKKYDTVNGIGLSRYNKLCFFKKIFGIKWGWKIWFIFTFVSKYGIKSLNVNYVYSHEKVKKKMDKIATEQWSDKKIAEVMEEINTYYQIYKKLIDEKNDNSDFYMNNILIPRIRNISLISLKFNKKDLLTKLRIKYPEITQSVFKKLYMDSVSVKKKIKKYRKVIRIFSITTIISVMVNIILIII